MTPSAAAEPSATERLLGGITLGLVLLSAASILITVIWHPGAGFGAIVATIPFLALPLAILLLAAATVVAVVRRRRLARHQDKEGSDR